jgi:hypothetical protein
MTESIDSVIEGFPQSNIEKVKGELTYHTIKDVEKKLIKNASSYQTELGSRNYGYLELILNPTKYELITRNIFTPYPNPGSIPTFPNNSIQLQIVQISTTHKE